MVIMHVRVRFVTTLLVRPQSASRDGMNRVRSCSNSLPKPVATDTSRSIAAPDNRVLSEFIALTIGLEKFRIALMTSTGAAS